MIDAHADALPLCRTMERTRNTVRQQRNHLKVWLDRGISGADNVGAGHIRWSKIAKGLTGRLGEFTAGYAGKAEDGKHHVLIVELASGMPATGFITAEGRCLEPRIAFTNKAKLRQEMAAALRTFGGATALSNALLIAAP